MLRLIEQKKSKNFLLIEENINSNNNNIGNQQYQKNIGNNLLSIKKF